MLVIVDGCVEEVADEPEIAAMFDAFSRERTDWDLDPPGTPTLRRMVALGDWAAAHPLRWRAYCLRHLDGLSVREVSERLGVSRSAARRLLAPVKLRLEQLRCMDASRRSRDRDSSRRECVR